MRLRRLLCFFLGGLGIIWASGWEEERPRGRGRGRPRAVESGVSSWCCVCVEKQKVRARELAGRRDGAVDSAWDFTL